MIQRIASSLLDTFFGSLRVIPHTECVQEPFCQCCGLPFEGQAQHTQFCFNCRNVKWKFRRARALYRMDGEVRELIHEFKYRGEHWLRRLFGESLYQAFLIYYKNTPYKAIVPVPLSARRLKERGFNQASELACYLSKKTHIPLCDCLCRKKDISSQAGLSRSMRIKNVRGVFEMRRKSTTLVGDYLLIDDVLTTGSTTSACAGVLLQSGASAVDVLTIARA